MKLPGHHVAGRYAMRRNGHAVMRAARASKWRTHAMPALIRQYFATSQQFADAVVKQIAQTPAENLLLNNALQAAVIAVQKASPDSQIVYGTFSYRTAGGKWVRQIDLLIGLASPLNHFRYAILLGMKNNLGDYYVDTSTMQTFDCTGPGSGIGTLQGK